MCDVVTGSTARRVLSWICIPDRRFLPPQCLCPSIPASVNIDARSCPLPGVPVRDEMRRPPGPESVLHEGELWSWWFVSPTSL